MDKKALEKKLGALQKKLSLLLQQKDSIIKEIEEVCNNLYKQYDKKRIRKKN